MKKKVLGITLILVMLISFMGCDGLTNVSKYSDEELEAVAVIGFGTAFISSLLYGYDTDIVDDMMTVEEHAESIEISWTNFDLQKALGKLNPALLATIKAASSDKDVNFDELSDYNVIIISGTAKQDIVNETLTYKFKFRIEGEGQSGTFRLYFFDDGEDVILTINNHSVVFEN